MARLVIEVAAILAEGVSRIGWPGEMERPPLDWPNGGRDLLTGLTDDPCWMPDCQGQ